MMSVEDSGTAGILLENPDDRAAPTESLPGTSES